MQDRVLTVIIPVYNAEKTIEDTLNSILSQSRDDFNILIIDDGSRDYSQDIINKLARNDDRIFYLYQENSGVSAARNTGIRNSKTKYISFLDADDLYEEKFVEKMLDKIEEDSSKVCTCGFYKESPKSKVKAHSEFREDDFLYDYIMGINKIHTSNFVIDRKFLLENEIFFNEKSSWGEDVEFFTKLLSKVDSCSVVKEYLTTYKIGFLDFTLSSFDLEKLNLDKEFVYRMVSSNEFDLNSKHKDAFIKYRLPGLLTYRLLEAIKLDYPKDEIKKYYKMYEDDINKYSLKYGIRGLKLGLNIRNLKIKIKKM